VYHATVANKLKAFDQDPLVLSMDNGLVNGQIDSAIKNKQPIKFKYNGKDQTVLPLRTYYNSKTGQTNVVGLTSKNKELTFSMNKIEVLPKTPLTPQQIRNNELGGLVNDIYNAYTPDPYQKYADSSPSRPYGSMPKYDVIKRLAAADLTPEERQAIVDKSSDKNYAQQLIDAAYPSEPDDAAIRALKEWALDNDIVEPSIVTLSDGTAGLRFELTDLDFLKFGNEDDDNEAAEEFENELNDKTKQLIEKFINEIDNDNYKQHKKNKIKLIMYNNRNKISKEIERNLQVII
jgi:hypothetical protein